MISLRSDTFNENFLNEADQDANSLLTQLDKGILLSPCYISYFI